MLWYQNAVYLSNCIYLIVLNATRDIFQILYSPPNLVITKEHLEWSCALFIPRSNTATGTSYLGKVTHSQPAKGEQSSLVTVPRLFAARSSVAPNRPWSSVSCPSHSQFLSLSPGKSSSLCPSPSLHFPSAPTRYILSMSLQLPKLLGLTSFLPKQMQRTTSSANWHCLIGCSVQQRKTWKL